MSKGIYIFCEKCTFVELVIKNNVQTIAKYKHSRMLRIIGKFLHLYHELVFQCSIIPGQVQQYENRTDE